jgi:hypothetical protein
MQIVVAKKQLASAREQGEQSVELIKSAASPDATRSTGKKFDVVA